MILVRFGVMDTQKSKRSSSVVTRNIPGLRIHGVLVLLGDSMQFPGFAEGKKPVDYGFYASTSGTLLFWKRS